MTRFALRSDPPHRQAAETGSARPGVEARHDGDPGDPVAPEAERAPAGAEPDDLCTAFWAY